MKKKSYRLLKYEDIEETMDINKTCTFNINNERTNHKLTLDLKMKCNNNTNET